MENEQIQPPNQPAPPVQPEGPRMQQQEKPIDKSADNKKEVMRAQAAIDEVLHQNVEMSDQILAIITQDDVVDSTTKAAITTVTQLDKRHNFSEYAIPSATVQAATWLIGLAQAKGINYSEEDKQNTMMATLEGIISGYGIPPEAMQDAAKSFDPARAEESQKIYDRVK